MALSKSIVRTYQDLRAKGSLAVYALRAAKMRETWDAMEADGKVRIRMIPDECYDLDGYNDWSVGPGAMYRSEKERDKARKDLVKLLDREGVWCIIGEYQNPAGHWCIATSVGAYEGDPTGDTGYADDIKSETIDKYHEEQAAVRVTIVWTPRYEPGTRNDGVPKDVEYAFKTVAEKEAFLLGLAEYSKHMPNFYPEGGFDGFLVVHAKPE